MLVDEVLPREPMRQWVLSVPFALRYLFATDPAVMGRVLGIVYRAIASQLIKSAGRHHATAQTGAVTLTLAESQDARLTAQASMIFWDIRLPTALRWVRSRGARRLPCRRCRQRQNRLTAI